MLLHALSTYLSTKPEPRKSETSRAIDESRLIDPAFTRIVPDNLILVTGYMIVKGRRRLPSDEPVVTDGAV